MDCVGELTTIDNRLGRAGGLAALHNSRLCQPDLPILGLPVLTRSAALLTLLLQDGTVDLELTNSVVALDPGLAFGTLQVANLERNGEGEIWQLPLAVVAAGCDRLLAMVNCAPKVESSYDCGTSAKLRQLYVRAVQRACIAELLTKGLGDANPKQSYVAGLLFGLPGILNLDRRDPVRSVALKSPLSVRVSADLPAVVATPSSRTGEHNAVAASVLIAHRLLEISGGKFPESFRELEDLTASPLWEAGDERTSRQRCQLLSQGCKLGKWAAANALRLSPWEFMTRLHRHKSWE